MQVNCLQQDLVWARMRFFPYWPARLVQTPPQMGKTPRGKTCVLFFGTKEFGFVERDKIQNYCDNRQKFVSKGRGYDFKNAVKQMDEYISNPTKFRSHAFVKPALQNIPIKTERDVERRLKIEPSVSMQKINVSQEIQRNLKHRLKKEPVISMRKSVNESKITKQRFGLPEWHQEKQMLVDQIVALKSESHSNLLMVKKIETDREAIRNEKKKCEQKMLEEKNSFLMQMKEMKQQITKIMNDYSVLKVESERKILDLKRENQILSARVKQFQSGIYQNPNQVYEVEAILNHKDTKNGRLYLIRWKGYDSDDDTWEKAENLQCPILLAEYLRSTVNNRK